MYTVGEHYLQTVKSYVCFLLEVYCLAYVQCTINTDDRCSLPYPQLLRQTSTEGNEGEVPPVESSGTQSSEGTGGALPGEKSRPTQSAIPTSLPTQDAPTQKKSEKPPSPVQNPQQSLSQAPSTVASPPTSTVPPAVSGPEQKATVLSLSAPEEPKVMAKTTPEDQPQAPTVPVEHDNLKSSSESSLVAESAVPDSQAPPPQPATDEPQPLITQPEAMTGDVKPGGSAERSTKLSIFPSQSQQDSQLPTVNGTGKKKPVRGKGKLRLNFLEVFGNKDKVVKCSLVTSGGQMVYFQFSMEYDKPQEIFQKFVRSVQYSSLILFSTGFGIVRCNNSYIHWKVVVTARVCTV